MTNDIQISVVICTRNRGVQLEACLASFQELAFDGAWELVIVDNSSTDNTAEVIARAEKQSRFAMRRAFEAVPGLARARNRGLSLAQGEIVAFTDDDCYPDGGYLAALHACFADRECAFGGGRVLLFDPRDRRVTIQESADCKSIAPNSFIRSGMMHGANMAFRRESLVCVNGFDERLGAGTFFRSGEDTDMFRRLSLAGMKGVYDPNIVVRHHHGRNTAEAERRLLSGYCRGRGACMAKYVANPKTRSLYARRWFWLLRGEATVGTAVRELLAAVLFSARYGPTASRIWEHPRRSLSAQGRGF